MILARHYVVCACLLGAPLVAQETPTIRVYTDRVQIPVLVLGSHREDLQPVPASEFRVMMDGHEFGVTIRREGDDPLEVSLLVDTSDSRNALLPLLQDAVATLSNTELKPTDHVSVYGMDGCRLRRTRELDPANPASIAGAIAEAMRFPSATQSECANRVGLWDALWYLTNSMRQLSGRRVIVPITNGVDIGSKKTPYTVWQSAIEYGISIFPVSERGHVAGASRDADNKMDVVMKASNLLSVSELSGGIVSEAIPPNLDFTLARIFHRLRERYVLEFPRPNGMYGQHSLDVSLRTMRAMVRTGGIEFPAKREYTGDAVTTDALPMLELPPPSATVPVDTRSTASDLPSTTTVAPSTAEAKPLRTQPVAQPVVDVTDITDELKPH